MYARRYRHNPPLTERQLRNLKRAAGTILLRIQNTFPEDQGFQDFIERNRLNLLMTIRRIQEDKVPHPKTVAEAIETIVNAADYLADLPPPGPEWMGLKDDVGLSASTDGPIRWYAANVTDEMPIETHLGAADYLRVHQKQIGPERWRTAFDILRAATDVDMKRAKQALTQAGRAALDPKGAVRALGDGSVAFKFQSRFTRKRLQDLGIDGDKLSFDQNTAEWIIRPGAIGDAIDALRVLLANDVLADQTQAMLDDGMIGMAAVPEPEPEPEAMPVVQEHDGVTWEWDDATGRVILQGLRLSTKVLNIRGLSKNKDYNWKKKGSDFFLFIEPAALRRVMTDKWVRKNITGASAFPYIQQWLDASKAPDADAVAARKAARKAALSAEEKAIDERCAMLVPIWKAASIDEVPDASTQRRLREINNRISWPAGLTPFAYQEVGIGMAVLRDGRAYIGDAMGLGKTLQAIGFLKYDVPTYTPACVVCPSGVIFNWRNEINKFAPELSPVPITSGKQGLPPFRPGLVLIMSWDMMKRYKDELFDVKTLIFDEAHYAKNAKSARTKVAMLLSSRVPHVLLLSGTPFPNWPIELYSQIKMIDPKGKSPLMRDLKHHYGRNDYIAFGEEYSAGTQITLRGGRRVWQFKGATNESELRDYLACMMMARTKTQPGIAGQLPPKIRTKEWIPLEGKLKRAYESAQRTFLTRACENAKTRVLGDILLRIKGRISQGDSQKAAIASLLPVANSALPTYGDSSEALMELGSLLRDVGKLKAPIAANWILEYLASAKPDAPLVVFVKHKEVLRDIGKVLKENKVRWTYVDGSVNARETSNRVEGFRNGEYQVLIATEKLREGANLQNSADMLFVERWWVPGYEEQAEGRVHRQGGRGVPVNIRYLMIEGTVDETISELVDDKREAAEAIFDGEDVAEAMARGKAPANIQQVVMKRMGADLAAYTECRFTQAELTKAYKAFKALEG